MTDFSRLIEHAFPLKQTSLDSVREKYGPRGHISGFHLWPARRPLAASRAAIIATLMPDPGDVDKRKELCEKIAGTVVRNIEKKKMPNGQIVERIREETDGGILQWKRETENADIVDWFRQEIRKANGGAIPKAVDPFAGGGAIPFEAMRLGCEATAVDINPVAWFILKCTLEYPQKLAGQMRPLPDFILHDDVFMAGFFKKAKRYGKAEITAAMKRIHQRLKKKAKVAGKGEQGGLPFTPIEGTEDDELQADLAWHVRAWGQWVLGRARQELAQYYPTYADFEPIKKDHIAYEHQPLRLVPLRDDGTPDMNALNGEFTEDYLADKRNPRWIAKPTVAYLWARTVTCKNCRATVPLLKTRWLCKKPNKRVRLTMEPNEDGTGVVFGIETNVPARGGNSAQKREHDKRIAAGTMSRAGAKCPCCPTIMTMGDIRVEGKAGKLGSLMTAIAVDGQKGKDYRLPTQKETQCATEAGCEIDRVYADLPYGLPKEPTPAGGGSGAGRAFSVQNYGLMHWCDLFTERQLVALGQLARIIRDVQDTNASSCGADPDWVEAIQAYLSASLNRLVDQSTTLCTWYLPGENVKHTFVRYALPIMWDYAETNPLFAGGGSWSSAILMCSSALDHALVAAAGAPLPHILQASSISATMPQGVELVVTDPPYYDAIPYSDLMDLFYIWLRRTMADVAPSYAPLKEMVLSPKWDCDSNDGELIDDESRHDGDGPASRNSYEDGMFRVFQRCNQILLENGRMVVVFAHKDPLAWETLAAAMIRAGFVVDASWPIQTENATRSRARASAALASSLWLVCKKRPETARPGWDNNVLEEMKANIADKLREFWDAGIRGPDFVWAATGPAMEAYSKHPVVRKANAPGEVMGVGEFLNHVRRMVVDYIVGQVLTGEQGADMAAADRLDEITAYYLLHRHDFGMDEAPVGACILYATACGLSDAELDRTWDIISRTGSASSASGAADSSEGSDDGDGDANAEPSEGTGGGNKVKLKAWNQRRGKSMGIEAPEGRVVPLIDRIHRVMHLWKEGDVQKVDEFLDQHALRRNELFKRVVQSLIELSTNSERSLLESISNHIGAKGAVPEDKQMKMYANDGEIKE